MPTYIERLKDQRWQKKRVEILTRDKWTCQHCGATNRTLHVHHAKYSASGKPWDIENDSLVTVCEPCHKQIESVITEFRKRISLSPAFLKTATILFYSSSIIGDDDLLEAAKQIESQLTDNVTALSGIKIKPPEVKHRKESSSSLDLLWCSLVTAFKRKSPFMSAYLSAAHPVSLIKNLLTIGFSDEFANQIPLIDCPKYRMLLSSTLNEIGHSGIQITFIKHEEVA